MIGWVKLHREIQNSWVWEDKPFSRGQAFIDLILTVNHEDRKIMFNGTLTIVKRGSTITSVRKLSDKWGWSSNKVNHFLKQLENDGMVTYTKDNKKTVVAIDNYDFYQSGESVKKHKRDTEESLKNIKSDTEVSLKKQKSNTEITLKNIKSNTEVNQKNTNKNDKEYIKNDKEGKEEANHNSPLSFPSPLYKKIFDKWGDISYRTWFLDTSISESNDVITINVPDNFRRKIIKERFLQYVTLLAGKKVVVN